MMCRISSVALAPAIPATAQELCRRKKPATGCGFPLLSSGRYSSNARSRESTAIVKGGNAPLILKRVLNSETYWENSPAHAAASFSDSEVTSENSGAVTRSHVSSFASAASGNPIANAKIASVRKNVREANRRTSIEGDEGKSGRITERVRHRFVDDASLACVHAFGQARMLGERPRESVLH